MKRISLLCGVLVFWAGHLFAQDPHFSQYFASPLSLNPALTGFFDGNFRFAVNERQQWWNVGNSYRTTSISADAKILPNILPENDVFAIGSFFIFDSSLGGALQSNYFSLSAAYHKRLDDQGKQMLTLGLEGTYANTYLDYSKLTFASQFNGFYFDTSVPVYPGTANSSTNYFDLHGGLLYAAHLSNADVYTGFSLYHIAQPTIALFNPAGDRLPYRKTWHAGGDVHISPASSILFSGLYMAQGGANDKMAGIAYGLKNEGYEQIANFYAGLWLRFNDAYIPYIGADYQNFSLGINYSVPYQQPTNYQPATFEISLIYHTMPGQSPHCPKF